MRSYLKHIQVSKQLALKAGEIMLKHFKQDMDFETKEDFTPVTVADKEINSLVISELNHNFPGHKILGEEKSDQTNLSNSHKEAQLWVCDPIDGTFPYSMGMQMSTFMLAYVEEGIPVTAVIYDPFRKLMFSAVKSHGAFRNDKQIKVNKVTTLNKQLIGVDSQLPEFFKQLVSANARVLAYLSYGFGATAVAGGQIAGAVYFYDKPWDGAAPSLIVNEAGGKATNLKGEIQKYNSFIDGVVCSNGLVHDQLIEVINKSC